MDDSKKDLYFYFTNSETYKYNIDLLALNKRRGFRHMSCAELVAASYADYDPAFPDICLTLLVSNRASKYFVENFNISVRNDVIYLLNHPEYVKEPDQNPIVSYKKIRFDVSDEMQKKAYDWLNAYKPRERIDEVLKVVRQYLIMNNDEYYTEQMALQLMMHLQRINRFSDPMTDETKQMLDVIWSIAGYSGKEKK